VAKPMRSCSKLLTSTFFWISVVTSDMSRSSSR
jgi:hypothetical protein